MRINSIILNNFGSYEGANSFDLNCSDPSKRIVIIGGKNGAGKTTLFTALKVCLYGHAAFGFKAAGKLYFREILKLVNDDARLNEANEASVNVVFNETRIDTNTYSIIRSWKWSNEQVAESFIVNKDGCQLSEEETIDYQNYLLHLIPPELLDLYFFDGERIAAYFFDAQHNNIKDALLTLSGNDTYDLLYGYVRRLIRGSESDNDSLVQDFTDQKEAQKRYLSEQNALESTINDLTTEIGYQTIELKRLRDAYAADGGVSIETWQELQQALKDEELLRERLNAEQKNDAYDVLPFIIVQPLLQKIKTQIELEKKLKAYQILQSEIQSKKFSRYLKKRLEDESDPEPIIEIVRAFFYDKKMDQISILFDLSEEMLNQILNTITMVNRFPIDHFKLRRESIAESIQKTKDIRASLQKSSIENYKTFVQSEAELTQTIQKLELEKEIKQRLLEELNKKIEEVTNVIAVTRKQLEEALKKKSVSDLSERVLLLVEELQEYQYKSLLHAVENDLNNKFQQLIRKSNFVDYIEIDSEFALHVIRNEEIAIASILDVLNNHGLKVLKQKLNNKGMAMLLQTLGTVEEELQEALINCDLQSIQLPIELDYTHFSNGEKQILVMALYWSIMNQSKNDLPFIIDTPFARIDTEHRANITEKFFKELHGQLFILSTNEELRHEHLSTLDEQIAKVFLLDYQEDKRTHIQEGNYF